MLVLETPMVSEGPVFSLQDPDDIDGFYDLHVDDQLLVDNMISGNIPEPMNQTVTRIEVVLRDDSPEDEDSGATFFPAGSDIIITYVDGQRDTGKDIRFEPVVQGGVPVLEGSASVMGKIPRAVPHGDGQRVFEIIQAGHDGISNRGNS